MWADSFEESGASLPTFCVCVDFVVIPICTVYHCIRLGLNMCMRDPFCASKRLTSSAYAFILLFQSKLASRCENKLGHNCFGDFKLPKQ